MHELLQLSVYRCTTALLRTRIQQGCPSAHGVRGLEYLPAAIFMGLLNLSMGVALWLTSFALVHLGRVARSWRPDVYRLAFPLVFLLLPYILHTYHVMWDHPQHYCLLMEWENAPVQGSRDLTCDTRRDHSATATHEPCAYYAESAFLFTHPYPACYSTTHSFSSHNNHNTHSK